jgi:type I restriction enzyme R subunit
MSSAYSEKSTVEDPALALLAGLGWTHVSLLQEFAAGPSTQGRDSKRNPYLPDRLRQALQRLNPDTPDTGVLHAAQEITRLRQDMERVSANRELLALLIDGVTVTVPNDKGEPEAHTIRIIDWGTPANNDFLLASQVWFAGDLGEKRADAVGFVNGIPLLFLEFKAPTTPVRHAYDHNLRDYRATIPQVFVPTGFALVSNGHETRLGPVDAPWDYWAEWKRLHEDDAPANSLELALRGTCAPANFLDIVENFLVFQPEKQKSGAVRLVKKVPRNHQVLGVNRAVQAVRDLAGNHGRLGVFWHTQGSGKLLSMLCFARKVFRKLAGNWTFVVITDRTELDDQIAETFAACGALSETIPSVQAGSSEHLRQLLREDHRYVFTLIHKFRPEPGNTMPVLSDRADIIVITDEAHRSQYDTLAANMRAALPNAAFIGFTGTPLIKGQEERTREVFGDYVSVYDFGQSIADNATVPLYYEDRIPELRLRDADLGEQFESVLEEAELDESNEARLQREFARQYALVTRDDRLETIARDVVRHFAGRGYRGKAMFVAIDKATAVRMYDKVQAHWQTLLAEKRAALGAATDEARQALQADYDWLRETDMAVVVSQGQNEIDELAKKGLDIVPHRKRMVAEELDKKFKDPTDALRLVFVCAMWITGFDVPSCSTIYLDKPMKNHTLMQTIARANRTYPGKAAGLIVDYIGVFANLRKALEIYAAGSHGVLPIRDKTALLAELRQKLDEMRAFLAPFGIDLAVIDAAQGLAKGDLLAVARERLLAPDDRRQGFLRFSLDLWKLLKSVLPDAGAAPLAPLVIAVRKIEEAIRNSIQPIDLDEIASRIDELLDASVVGVEITKPLPDPDNLADLVDLSRIDFDRLRQLMETGKSATAIQLVRNVVDRKVRDLVARNPLRMGFWERFQALLADYNARRLDADQIFAALLKLLDDLDTEEKRHARESLSEDELALFDLLTQPDPILPTDKRDEVKRIARSLLQKLRALFAVVDWQSKPTIRARVTATIRSTLRDLPEEYDDDLWTVKTEATQAWILQHYASGPPPPAS